MGRAWHFRKKKAGSEKTPPLTLTFPNDYTDPNPARRWLLVEHLNDVVYAVQHTPGCHAYVRDAENLASLRQFAYGSNTRWNYWIDVVERLQPATRRYDRILTFLLHAWLLAEGHNGLGVPPSQAPPEGAGASPASGSSAEDKDVPDWVLSGPVLGEKIELLKNKARCALHPLHTL